MEPTNLPDAYRIGLTTCEAEMREQRFNHIKSRILDCEAELQDLCAEEWAHDGAADALMICPKALQRRRERWQVFDEQWLQLREIRHFDNYADLERAYFAAIDQTCKNPRDLRLQEQERRLRKLWLACVQEPMASVSLETGKTMHAIQGLVITNAQFSQCIAGLRSDGDAERAESTELICRQRDIKNSAVSRWTTNLTFSGERK